MEDNLTCDDPLSLQLMDEKWRQLNQAWLSRSLTSQCGHKARSSAITYKPQRGHTGRPGQNRVQSPNIEYTTLSYSLDHHCPQSVKLSFRCAYHAYHFIIHIAYWSTPTTREHPYLNIPGYLSLYLDLSFLVSCVYCSVIFLSVWVGARNC